MTEADVTGTRTRRHRVRIVSVCVLRRGMMCCCKLGVPLVETAALAQRRRRSTLRRQTAAAARQQLRHRLPHPLAALGAQREEPVHSGCDVAVVPPDGAVAATHVHEDVRQRGRPAGWPRGQEQ